MCYHVYFNPDDKLIRRGNRYHPTGRMHAIINVSVTLNVTLKQVETRNPNICDCNSNHESSIKFQVLAAIATQA